MLLLREERSVLTARYMLVFSQLRHTTGSKPGEHNDNMVIMVMVIIMVIIIMVMVIIFHVINSSHYCSLSLVSAVKIWLSESDLWWPIYSM